MNWEAIGAVGEVLGAIAVVASLSYLAAQIRNQNRETRLAAMHETLIALREFQAPLLMDRHLADLVNRGLENIDSLESDEATQFASFLNGGCRHWEDSFYQYREGRLDERIWESIGNQYSPIRSTPGFQRYWELRDSYYSNDFREYVDGLKDSKVWIALKKDLQS